MKKSICKKLICILTIIVLLFNYIVPQSYAATYSFDFDAMKNEIVTYFSNANANQEALTNSNQYIYLVDYSIKNKSEIYEETKEDCYQITLSFRIFLMMLGGVDTLTQYKICGGTKEMTGDDDMKAFFDQVKIFYEDYPAKYVSPNRPSSSDFDSYMVSYKMAETSSMYYYYEQLFKTNNNATNTFKDNLDKFIEELRDPFEKYVKEITQEKDDDEDDDDVDIQSIYAKIKLREINSDDEDSNEKIENSIAELTEGNIEIGAYDDVQDTVTTDDFDTTGSTLSFRYLGRRASILLGTIFCSLVDGMFNIMQSCFLPGTPKAVAKRVESEQSKTIANNNIEYGYYYAYYNSGKRGNASWWNLSAKKLPVYVNFSLKSTTADLEQIHREWFGYFSNQPVPMIMYGPQTILSNKIPMFDVNFFSTTTNVDNPILEFTSADEYAKYMIKASAKKNQTNEGNIIDSELGNLYDEYVQIYNDAKAEKDSGKISSLGSSSANYLSPYVAKWYLAIRNIALLLLCITLVYTGIRIIVSTTGDKKAKYKEMLWDWIQAVMLVLFIHYIMILLVSFTNIFTSTISGYSVFNEYGGDRTVNLVRFKIVESTVQGDFNTLLAYLLIYTYMAYFTWKITIVFIKRVFYMALLTILAPLIGLSFSVDKISDGKSQAFDTWFREYLFNLLQMPIYLIIYLVLIDTAVRSASEINLIFVIACLMSFDYVLQAIKDIFNVRFNNEKGASPTFKTLRTMLFGGMLSTAFSTTTGLAKKMAKSNRDQINKIRENRENQNYLDYLKQKQEERQKLEGKTLSDRTKIKIKGALNNTKQKIKDNISLEKNKKRLKNGTAKLGKDIKLRGKKLGYTLVQNAPKIMYKGTKYVLVGGASLAAGAIAFGKGVTSGDADAAINNVFNATILTYRAIGGLTDSMYKVLDKGFDELHAQHEINYAMQQLGLSDGAQDEQNAEKVKGQAYEVLKANYKPQDKKKSTSQTSVNVIPKSDKWLLNPKTRETLKQHLEEELIDTRADDLKTLYLAGVKENALNDALDYIDENPQIDKDMAAVLYANKGKLDKISQKEIEHYTAKLKVEKIKEAKLRSNIANNFQNSKINQESQNIEENKVSGNIRQVNNQNIEEEKLIQSNIENNAKQLADNTKENIGKKIKDQERKAKEKAEQIQDKTKQMNENINSLETEQSRVAQNEKTRIESNVEDTSKGILEENKKKTMSSGKSTIDKNMKKAINKANGQDKIEPITAPSNLENNKQNSQEKQITQESDVKQLESSNDQKDIKDNQE